MHEVLEEEVRRILKYVLEGASTGKGILTEMRPLMTSCQYEGRKRGTWRESFRLQDDMNNLTR